jgi:hypothetical protein
MENSKNRVLFIAPEFNSYHTHIINQLFNNGFVVDFIKEKQVGFFWDLLCKVSPKTYSKLQKKHLINKFKQQKHIKYQTVFLIRGEFVGSDVITFIKTNFEINDFISYQWDSIKNNPAAIEQQNNDFRMISFDRDDCSKYNFEYLPLFYIENNRDNKHEVTYDLSCVCVYTKERLITLLRVLKVAKQQKLTCHFKIKINLLTYLYHYFTFSEIRELPLDLLTFRSIPYTAVIDLMKSSKAVLDICHPSQSGLTMRTVECVGLNVKIITNNKNVMKEPFFTEDLIKVTPDFNTQLDSFIRHDTQSYSHSEQYQLINWLKNIFRT